MVDMRPDAAWGVEVRRVLEPDSPVGESFEELAESLFALPGPPGSVVVTSPGADAGRSSVCLGLGAALAAKGRRTAVLDCNLDRPHLHRFFDRPNFTGLTNALRSGKPPEAYSFEVTPGLHVVPTGPLLAGTASLVESGRLVEAVRGLAERGFVALLDAPPAGRVLESSVFSGGFDGVLLVVHATRTPKGDARRATDDLLDAGINLLGVVLNGCV